jgi:N utilization substance protein B
MVSRRLIRIKSFQILYSQFSKTEIDFNDSYKELNKSISKTQDLFFLILRLIVDVKDLAVEKTEINKQKRLATSDDLNPNTIFIENSLIRKIEENKQYQRFNANNGLNWNNYPTIVEKVYRSLLSNEVFVKYIGNSEKPSFKDDKKIISFLLEEIISEQIDIIDALEEISIYWTEDFEFVINNVLKVIRTIKQNDSEEKVLSSIYKNDDDKQFAYDLLKYVLQEQDNFEELIEKHAKNWEIERIIQIDILLMQMALAELIYMPSIPINVTLDEYIELSKFYSSSKSKIFINGILDKIISELKEDGKILKKGRGLIGQV